jgi:arsenate reductase
MTYILLHNPKCSTSRAGLALLQEQGIEPELRLYMSEEGRLSVAELKSIARKLKAKSPRAFLRDKDAEGLSGGASDEEVYAAMADDPSLIQRPIGLKGRKAALGRPAERLLDIL